MRVYLTTIAQVLRFLPAAVTVLTTPGVFKGRSFHEQKEERHFTSQGTFCRCQNDRWHVDCTGEECRAGRSPSGYIRQLITNQKIILKPEVVFESWELLDVFRKDWRQSQPDCKASKRRRNIYGRGRWLQRSPNVLQSFTGWEMNIAAIIKHISIKNANYDAATEFILICISVCNLRAYCNFIIELFFKFTL